MRYLVSSTWHVSLSKVQESQKKRMNRIDNTVSELRTQLTQQFAKSAGGASGSARGPASAARTPGGFSIVELILSITIGVLFITSVTQIINNYISLGQKSRNVILANSYVEGKVEMLRNIGYNGLNAGITNLSAELPPQLPTPRSASLTITTPSSGLKQADISVTYNDKGKSQTYSYSAYIGELSVVQ